MEAIGDQGWLNGESSDLRLKTRQTRRRGVCIWELEHGGVLEVLSQSQAEEAEKGLAAIFLNWLAAQGIVPWKGVDVAEV